MGRRTRKRRGEAGGEPRPSSTTDYVDPDGNVLTLRDSLSERTLMKLAETPASAAASIDDAWRRRTEMLFERLAVRWELAGLPLEKQSELLGRYRMASTGEQRWVRRTLDEHLERVVRRG
jgi:hypothetical protein